MSVNGQSIGTLSAYVSQSPTSSCTSSSGRVVTTVTAGVSHTYTAVSDRGTTWNGTISVNANGCRETYLECPNGNCAPTNSQPGLGQCVPNNTGSTAVRFHNSTTLALQVSFSGPTTRSGTVAAGASQTFSLSPGSYQVTVSGTGVQPLTRTYTLSSSCTYDLVITFSSLAPSSLMKGTTRTLPESSPLPGPSRIGD